MIEMVVFVIPFMNVQIGPDLYLKAQIEIKSVQKGLYALRVTSHKIGNSLADPSTTMQNQLINL
jgi:hypothetical protein